MRREWLTVSQFIRIAFTSTVGSPHATQWTEARFCLLIRLGNEPFRLDEATF